MLHATTWLEHEDTTTGEELTRFTKFSFLLYITLSLILSKGKTLLNGKN